MTTKTQSLTADAVREKILNSTGQFVKVKWQSDPKPAAAFKSFQLKKITEGVCRAGIDYANLGVVKEGIESGERGEVQPLPWGEWLSFPYIITHKGSEYIRLYPSIHKPHSIFYVNDELVTKEEFAKYLTPSEASKLLNPQGEDVPLCFTIKSDNILEIPQEVSE